MRFGHISEQEARSRLEVAEEENLKLRHKLHAFETASWADAVQECEGWRLGRCVLDKIASPPT